MWFQAQGIGAVDGLCGTAYDDSALLYQAVLVGQGAGLLPAAMVAGDMTDGRLLRLAGTVLLRDFAYYLVYPEDTQDRPKIAAFRSWIVQASGAASELGAAGVLAA